MISLARKPNIFWKKTLIGDSATFFYFCMLSSCILFSSPPQVEAAAWCCNVTYDVTVTCYCYSIMMIRWNVMIIVSQYCYNHIPHVTKSLHHNNSVSQNCKIKRKILHRTRTAAENACCSTLWLRLIRVERDVSWRRLSASASASLSYYQHHSITTSQHQHQHQ